MSRLWIYYWLFQFHYRLGFDFDFTMPGLEVKFACEEAEKLGAKIHFLGPEMDQLTWNRLYHETRFNVGHYLMKRYQYYLTPWIDELESNRQKVHQAGPKIFTEQCLD